MKELNILGWLQNFSLNLKRKTTRTQRCRLLLSVERMEFENDHNAATWKNVAFNNGKVILYDGEHEKLETSDITFLQREIIRKNQDFQGERLSRYDIKEEYGTWKLGHELTLNLISAGGEAIILTDTFGDVEMAVRVHVFDPFLFTEQMPELPRFKIFYDSGMTRIIVKVPDYICISHLVAGSNENLRLR